MQLLTELGVAVLAEGGRQVPEALLEGASAFVPFGDRGVGGLGAGGLYGGSSSRLHTSRVERMRRSSGYR